MCVDTQLIFCSYGWVRNLSFPICLQTLTLKIFRCYYKYSQLIDKRHFVLAENFIFESIDL